MPRPWSSRELATLAAIAETFVPGSDGPRRAELMAGALTRAADPAQVDQFRLVLRAMEIGAVNAALGGGPRAVSAMGAAERERYLLGWAHSRVPQRRTVFGTLRKLATFLAYGDPGTSEAPNPRLAAIGYAPERPPVTPIRTPIVPHALPFEGSPADLPLTMDADVVIVGSGAGGGVVAAELAAAGRSVVVLEAGPFVDEASMPTDEMDAFSRLYLNHGLLATWDGSILLLAGSSVGGGTLVNWMTTIAPPAEVRDEWRRDHGLDGLEDGDAWSTDVEAIERDLAVTETAYVPPKDEVILRGAASLGWDAAPTRRNGPGCDDCGSCPFGCRRGTKQSGIRAHLASAYRHGARIVPRVRVTRVLIEGGQAVGVEGLALEPDPRTGDPIEDLTAPGGVRVRPLRVMARQVVVAAGALRTPAVLAGSGLEHPSIGRYLRIHPVSGVVTRMSTPVELWRGPMQGARCGEFVVGEPGRAGYVIESAPGHPGLLAQSIPWEGASEHAALMADAPHIGALVAVTRDGGEGRTSLTRAGRVRIDYRLDAAGVATLRHALGSMARLAYAGGALEVMAAGTRPEWFRRGSSSEGDGPVFARFLESIGSFDFSPNRGTVLSAHQMGTARMGAAPRDHVCDPGGRVRAGTRDDTVISGLYVADTSLFPTGLGVNPMLTVMALARRVSRTVSSEA